MLREKRQYVGEASEKEKAAAASSPTPKLAKHVEGAEKPMKIQVLVVIIIITAVGLLAWGAWQYKKGRTQVDGEDPGFGELVLDYGNEESIEGCPDIEDSGLLSGKRSKRGQWGDDYRFADDDI